MNDEIKVGGVVVPLNTAKDWVRDYTSTQEPGAAKPYSYPSYDHYQGGGRANELSDGDLLAPVLLNVMGNRTIRTFTSLQAIRRSLESALVNVPVGESLESMDSESASPLLEALYALLDLPDRQAHYPGVRGTTLSKVLHRKRPAFIPLYDKWVDRCYVGSLESGRPVQPDKNRTPASFMSEVAVAIGDDLRNQREAFARLDSATRIPGDLTHLRLLDIIAWTSRGVSREA